MGSPLAFGWGEDWVDRSTVCSCVVPFIASSAYWSDSDMLGATAPVSILYV